jgi:tripartite-type tricarboxylate transporter receptor subunit TctC/DNA-binding SARP family transcriptional activator/energy-coupling factor transporter ATP-binding protein EcfA2
LIPSIASRSRASGRVRVGASVQVSCLNGTDWEPKGNAALVLAWVVIEGHADRRRLSAALWPHSDSAQARSNLRVLTYRINRKFGAELLMGGDGLEIDAALAGAEVMDPQALLATATSVNGTQDELLADADVDTEAGEVLSAWLAQVRHKLRRSRLEQLGEAASRALAANEPARAAVLAGARVQIDPLSEHAHRQFMDALARCGDRAAALQAYERCKQVLRERLGVLPGLQTRDLHLRILQEQSLESAPGPLPALLPALLPFSDASFAGARVPGGAARYPLVEREAALLQVQAALGAGLHVVMHGEPGVGKTRLLQHLTAGAQPHTEAVGFSAALKREPYAAVSQLLQEVQSRRKPRIDVPDQVELARLAPLAFGEVKPAETSMVAPRLHAALALWMRRLGEAGVQVLVLDDVHHADSASQAALASLLLGQADAAAGAPTLLLAHRSGDIDAVLEAAAVDAQARNRARRIETPRLSLAGVQALLHAIAHTRSVAQQPPDWAEQILRRTGGNPLFVIELAQQWSAQGDSAGVENLRPLLSASLQACAPAAQQLAAVAAVAGEHFSVELAAAVTGASALALTPAWHDLQQRGLFAGHGPAHELVVDAVLAELPAAIRRHLHRQVGRFLDDRGARGPAVLRHWLVEPVRLVVPFAPGGTTDLLARIVAQRIGQALGQSVVVENKAGAGGAIGAAEVAKSAPDGCVLLLSSASTMAANPAINPDTCYDPVQDFEHISTLAATPTVMAVHPSFPSADYEAFVATLRENPGRCSYGTAGTGSIAHVLVELYKSMARAHATHVPYRGSGPALNDAVAGHLPIVVDNLPSALPFIKDRRLVPIVVAAPKRLDSLPDVPTFADLGLEPVNRMSFLGLSAPKGTPRGLVEALNAAVKSALSDANVRARMEATGAIVLGSSAQEYQQQVSDELSIYRQAVRAQRLKLN